MRTNFRFHALDAKLFNSRIKSRNTTKVERWLGYFFGPAGAIMFNAIIISYLNIYYTDVLNLGAIGNGLFLVVFPIVSKVVDAVTNLAMGLIIDKTKSRRGKARPWILVSAPLVSIAGLLLFAIPKASLSFQLIWVVASYNLYYSFAYTIYNMSHYLMVPLSTRNVRQRNQLSVFTNIANTAVTGMFIALVFTMLIYPIMRDNTAMWVPVMSSFSILALPLILLEYFFTRERVTEETMHNPSEVITSVKQQLKAMFKSRYWLLILSFQLLFQFVTQVTNLSGMYFFNWVLAPSYDQGANMSALVNIFGGFPLGIGMFVAWPLAKRFGKRNITIIGFVLSIIGTAVCLINPGSFTVIIIGKILQSFGSIPIMYIFTALFADTLDFLEWKNNFRCDGIATSFINVIVTLCFGMGTGFFNAMLSFSGYISPEVQKSAGTAIASMSQAAPVQQAITFSWLWLPLIIYVALLVIIIFLDVEKHMPVAHAKILERQKLACEKRGEQWLTPDERAKVEQDKMDAEALEHYKMELAEKCRKNAKLDYDTLLAAHLAKEEQARRKREQEEARSSEKEALYDKKMAAIAEKKAQRKRKWK